MARKHSYGIDRNLGIHPEDDNGCAQWASLAFFTVWILFYLVTGFSGLAIGSYVIAGVIRWLFAT